MTSEVFEKIASELEQLRTYSDSLGRSCGLISADGGDIRQDAYLDIAQSCYRRPGLADHIWAMPGKQRLAFIRGCLVHAARTLRRKEKLAQRRWVSVDDIEFLQRIDSSPCELEDARRVITKVRSELGKKGRFALETVLAGSAPGGCAGPYGMTDRNARRWFAEGIKLVAKAAERILAQEYGDEALNEFVRVVRVYAEACVSYDPSLSLS